MASQNFTVMNSNSTFKEEMNELLHKNVISILKNIIDLNKILNVKENMYHQ